MNPENATLLTLLRVALSGKVVGCSLSANIDWQVVFRLAQAQGVVALASEGLQRLCACDQATGRSLPRALKLQWIAAAEQIRDRYELQKKAVAQLTRVWAKNGIVTLSLKGMAFATTYPVPDYRECGDIDCYLFGDYEKGEEIIRRQGIRVDEEWYKHAQFRYMGVLVENHAFLVPVRKNREYHALEQHFRTLAERGPNERFEDTNLLLPSPLFNLSFCLYHAMGHFLSEGIHLRHLCDWYCLLTTYQNKIDWDAFYGWCEQFHYQRFADALTAICVHDLGMSTSEGRIVTQSPYRQRVLESILHDDAAIYSLNKPKWYRRSKLIYNIFRYHWKYVHIYQKSPIRQVANYVLGYLFKTERNNTKNYEK